jgi:hypothetical protein
MGTLVSFFVDPASRCRNDAQRLGMVAVPKTNSCDIIVYTNHGVEYRHDCLYIDDPQVASTQIWSEPGRGLFCLTDGEKLNRDTLRQARELNEQTRAMVAAIDRKVATIESHLEQLAIASASASAYVPQRGRPRKAQETDLK